MWEESRLVTLTLNGVLGRKKITRDGHKEEEVCDIIVEVNKTKSKFCASVESSDNTFDLISMKDSNSARNSSTKSNDDDYFKNYAIKKAKSASFKISEDPYWIKSDDIILELYSNRRLAARIYKKENYFDCYVFYRGKRFDDYIRFKDDDINNSKFLCIDKANLMGWRIDYE